MRKGFIRPSPTSIEITDTYLPTPIPLVIIHPYEPKALMRFTASIYLNGLSSKADSLIETPSSRNFVGTEFVIANGFYKDCKTALKMTIRVASEQRISTTNVVSL